MESNPKSLEPPRQRNSHFVSLKRCLRYAVVFDAAFLAVGVVGWLTFLMLWTRLIPGASERGILGITSLDVLSWCGIASTLLLSVVGFVGGAFSGYFAPRCLHSPLEWLYCGKIFRAAGVGALLGVILGISLAILLFWWFVDETWMLSISFGQMVGQGVGFAWGIKGQQR